MMRVAVTTEGPSLEARVDVCFGRCSCFLIVDTEGLSLEAVENPYTAVDGDAGVQTAQLMVEKAVEVVLTPHRGPRAHQSLSVAKIGVILGRSGFAREVVERFKREQGPTADEPDVPCGFGTSESLTSLMRKYPPSPQGTSTADKTIGSASPFMRSQPS